jgi:hypothetical protein
MPTTLKSALYDCTPQALCSKEFVQHLSPFARIAGVRYANVTVGPFLMPD